VSPTPEIVLGPKTTPEADPFRYGWRYVKVTRPDGTEDFEQVPLTLEDVLHPQEEDFIVHTDGHNEGCRYLKSVLKARLAGDPSAVVLSDCRVDWGVPGLRPLGPDIAVFFGVGRHRDWGTFHVAEEGAQPALVIEITSPETRQNDLGIKVDYYHRAGVPHYVIVDVRVRGEGRRLDLIGYRYTSDGYEPLEPDERGRLWLERVGLWLGVAGDRVAFYDPDTGREIGDYTELSQAITAEAQARAEAEARAEALARTATAEAQARADLEARLREMEAELRRVRGEA
jgi:colicin import membrane protein